MTKVAMSFKECHILSPIHCVLSLIVLLRVKSKYFVLVQTGSTKSFKQYLPSKSTSPFSLNNNIMPTKPNSRDAIESLLATSTSPGSYSCGSKLTCPIPTVKIIKSNERGDATGCASLSFPLDANGIDAIKANAQRAGVGLKDKTVVNLDVRTTYVHMICTM